MFTFFEWMQSLDPAKVERERLDYSYRAPDTLDRHRPPARFIPKHIERDLSRKVITTGLDLTIAQQRAIKKWLEGKGL